MSILIKNFNNAKCKPCPDTNCKLSHDTIHSGVGHVPELVTSENDVRRGRIYSFLLERDFMDGMDGKDEYQKAGRFMHYRDSFMEWYDFSFICLTGKRDRCCVFSGTQPCGFVAKYFWDFCIGLFDASIGAFFFGHLGDRQGRKSTLF